MEFHMKAHDQGLVSFLWNNDRFFRNPGHLQVFKSRNKKCFHLRYYFLDEVVTRQTINAG
jgi:hypothetical protein